MKSAATGAAIAAAYESGLRSSSWQQLRSMAIGAIGIAQDVAARAVPHVMAYIAGNRAHAPGSQPAAAENDVLSQGNGQQMAGKVNGEP